MDAFECYSEVILSIIRKFESAKQVRVQYYPRDQLHAQYFSWDQTVQKEGKENKRKALFFKESGSQGSLILAVSELLIELEKHLKLSNTIRNRINIYWC